MEKPKVIAYDLEFAREVPNNDWNRMTECGVAVCCSWSSEESEPRVWIPDEGAHVWPAFARHVLEHDVYLTWNGMACDDLLIHAQFPLWERVLQEGKRLDLCIVAGLYAIADRKGLDRALLDQVLSYGVPNNFPKLVGYKEGASVSVKAGWTLDGTWSATFPDTKAKSMDGALAPKKWQEGKRGEVIGYCCGDVYRLLLLWEYVWDGGSLKSKRGWCVVLPFCALGRKPA